MAIRMCSVDGCGQKHDARGLCKKHYGQRYGDFADIEWRRARWRARNHHRRVLGRDGDVTPAYELMLRTKAKRCPMPGCNVKLVNEPYLPVSKELDHIIPRGVGGTHTVGNVRIICRDCNVRRPKDGSDYTGPVTLWAEVA